MLVITRMGPSKVLIEAGKLMLVGTLHTRAHGKSASDRCFGLN